MAAATPSASAVKRTLSSSGINTHQSSQRKRHQPSLETSPNVAAEQMRRTYEAQLTALQLQVQEAKAEARREQQRRIEQESTVAALERERSSLLERWDERQEDLQQQARAEWLEEKHELEKVKGRLEVAQSETAQELEEVRYQLREAQHQLRQAQKVQESSEEFSRDLEVQNNNLRAELSRIQQSRSSPAPSTPSKRPASQVQADKIIQRELNQHITHVKSLEASNSKLKRENARLSANIEHTALLRERLATLQVQVKSIPRYQAQLAQAETELQILKADQQSWLVFLQDDNDEASSTTKWRRPEDLARELARVTSQNEVLQRRLEMAKETHAGMNELVASLERRIDDLEAEVEQEKQQQARCRKTIRSLERYDVKKLPIVSRHLNDFCRSEKLLQTERGFLLAQLDNYALERRLETDTPDDGPTDSMRQEFESLKSQLSAALEQLQDKVVPEDRSESSTTPGGQDVRQRFTELMEQNATLVEELSSAHTQFSLAQRECASLEVQVDKLSSLLGVGAYDPSTTRVLEFKENPASKDLAVRTQEIELLTKENKALLARLEAAGHKQGSESSVPSETIDVLQAELKKVKETLEQKDKVAQRIKEVKSYGIFVRSNFH